MEIVWLTFGKGKKIKYISMHSAMPLARMLSLSHLVTTHLFFQWNRTYLETRTHNSASIVPPGGRTPHTSFKGHLSHWELCCLLTRAALEEHIKRVPFQAGYVCIDNFLWQNKPYIPSPGSWGWVESEPFGFLFLKQQKHCQSWLGMGAQKGKCSCYLDEMDKVAECHSQKWLWYFH